MFYMTFLRLFNKIIVISLLFVGAVYADEMIVDYSENSIPILNNELQQLNKGIRNTHSIPSGGTTGQVLTKSSATNYASSWTTINSIPTGGVIPYAGSTAPTGYLICDGATVSKTTYAALFAVTGHTYGADPGGGNFILPNLKGRTVIGVGQGSTYANGVDAAGTDFTLAASSGMEKHIQTTAEMAAHTHQEQFLGAGGLTGATLSNGSAKTIGPESGTTGGGAAMNTVSTGNSTAATIMQPYIVLSYLIKT